MWENDYSLGGEQSGHIIIKNYATTGDGLLTAIMITEEICDSKTPLEKLAQPVMLYPQYVKNIVVKNKKAVVEDEFVKQEVKKVEELINKQGRVLLRQSGTEMKIRIMIEAISEQKCQEYADMIANVIKERGYTSE